MASRDLTAGMLTAIAAGAVRPAILYAGEFWSGGALETVRLWTGIGTLSWDGYSWLGGGKLLGISPLEENDQVVATGFTVSLSGIASADVARVLASVRQGRPGTLWLACFDAAGALVADPYQLASGKLDVPFHEDDGSSATITVQYESRLIDLEKPRIRSYTVVDQWLTNTADIGFHEVPSLQDVSFVWGR